MNTLTNSRSADRDFPRSRRAPGRGSGSPAHDEGDGAQRDSFANRFQAIPRYDLRDSVMLRPDPCPCGNPLPAVRGQGRAADLLTFLSGRGGKVGISPMFGTLLDRAPGVEDQFQLVQTAPTTLRVRPSLGASAGVDRLWHAVRDGIGDLLTDHGVGDVVLELAPEPPQNSSGGKFRRIIPLVPSLP